MTNQDMEVSYVFKKSSLTLGGFYKARCKRHVFKGILVKITEERLDFFTPSTRWFDSENRCGIDINYIYAKDFHKDDNAYITELSE